MNKITHIDMAMRASKHHLEGSIDNGEFCLAVLRIFFNSLTLEWDRVIACFTKTQREIIRTFADSYFSENGYAPRPDLPPAATEAEKEEAVRFHKEKWVGLHRWIVQATGGN